MLLIGSHVSFQGDQLLGSAKEALSYKANTFMFYTGAPQNTFRRSIQKEVNEEASKFMEEHGIYKDQVICHAPYIINLANKKDLEKWQFSIQFLQQELSRCDALGIKKMVLHPGSAVGYPKMEALENIAEALNLVLKNDYQCKILIETMAGKGTECGSKLEEIQYLIDHVQKEIGVCLDTCHLNDSGVDLTRFDEYLEQFDLQIGISKIGCVHVNDSKNPLSSHKDRHENIGYGTIGFSTLLKIIYHEKLKEVPKILETPYVGKSKDDKERLYPPYLFEIEMIRKETFDDHLLEHVNEYYNK